MGLDKAGRSMLSFQLKRNDAIFDLGKDLDVMAVPSV